MDFTSNGKLLVACGNLNYFGTTFYDGTAMVYDGDEWLNFQEDEVKAATGLFYQNITSLAEDPAEQGHYFASSFGYGLYEFRNGEFVKHYNHENSELESVLKPEKSYRERYVRVARIKYDNEGVNLIANAGQGSVRDALSIADMCVSYSSGNVTYNSVLEVLGASDPAKIARLADAVASGDVDGALSEVAAMCDLGKSMPILASDLSSFFRNVLYIKTCKNAKQLLSIPDTTYALLVDVAGKYSVAKCMTIMKAMNALEGDFRYSTQHRILLEAAIVSCAAGPEASDNAKIRELEAKVALLEKKVKSMAQSGFKPTPVKSDARQVWQSVASELMDRGQRLLALAVPEADVSCDDKTFTVAFSTKATYDILTDKKNRDILNEVFSNLSNLDLNIKHVAKYEEDKSLPYVKEMFGSKLEIK
jgi:DNA polymerase III gamma/tau subunit